MKTMYFHSKFYTSSADSDKTNSYKQISNDNLRYVAVPEEETSERLGITNVIQTVVLNICNKSCCFKCISDLQSILSVSYDYNYASGLRYCAV
jgi:5-keto 4-deoxyuronate isomerase